MGCQRESVLSRMHFRWSIKSSTNEGVHFLALRRTVILRNPRVLPDDLCYAPLGESPAKQDLALAARPDGGQNPGVLSG